MSGKPSFSLSRRQALGLIAVTAGGGAFLPASAMAAQSSAPQASLYAGLALFETGAGVCAITPEVTEGPFYFDPKLERADVTEGKKGIALAVRLQVVDAGCRPLAGARVDIWHCDAQGAYSGYPGQGDGRDVDTSGQTFLRGWQKTDARGIVSFATIYPGWYRGRTTHIHFKVFPDDRSVMTGQLFFPTVSASRSSPLSRPTMTGPASATPQTLQTALPGRPARSRRPHCARSRMPIRR
ncbi:dioxygenase-like protein [Mesorhizobium loti]|uniref:Dioxygenase-like protein n=1 Tax=Rhizobium loti TaxID=381 RepID=A0A8E3B501_RHILI|nr:dioxygenase-like protein [Mesorhizobium loti]